MCGILGVLKFRATCGKLSLEQLLQMRDAMMHRGPDGSGAWISDDGQVALAHRRLSIIDLSPAAGQPMSNEDGSLRIVFNGEIYNHAEIRAELEGKGGYRWKTDHSDTEVILHAFAQWGIDCVQRFRGMFAFGLWDARERQLWLVRDRIGIKPLYYSIHHGKLIFASEIKALLQDPEQNRAVNVEALYHFLSFLTTPSPNTLFQGIYKLPAATWLRVNYDGSIHQHRYWELYDHTKPVANISEGEICHQIRAELRTAVQLRKVSDVPVGVFLSGGIDSSVNAALFSENQTEPIRTFSIGYDADYRTYPNELPYARQMAQHVGADHHERILSQQDLLDFLPEMVHLQDEPIADPVCVPVYYVSKLARQSGMVVCQVGEGADELFCGYPAWKTLLRLQRCGRLWFPSAAKKASLTLFEALGYADRRPYELLRRNATGVPIFWGGAEAFTETQKQRLLSPCLRQQLRGLTSWDALRPIRQRFLDNAWETSDLAWMSYLDLNFRLPELLLMRVDKMSMGVSLETRVPFLDHKFVELVMSIPAASRYRHGTLKYLLKKSVRGLIPDQLIDRQKQGFGVPVYEWFATGLGDFARNEIATFCRETNFFDVIEVKRLLETDRKRSWYLLNFALWWKQYIGCAQEVPVTANILTGS
ncbi:MAG TPA: asparagine synthase (glutamine-hydrolyzing) [Terriglobales bacterium]|nr:asparagine synthase (glutamine-hydrolyzing) [Terriglobales bacterium]